MVKKAFLLVLVLLLTQTPLLAQQETPHHFVELTMDSGLVPQHAHSRSVTYSQEVRVEGATWLRLFFADTELGDLADGSAGTYLRITSLKDGAVQNLNATTLAQWRHSSAFFNGDTVRVELVAEPGAEASRFRIREAMVGEPGEWDAEKSICGPTDDRTLSSDPKTARIVPVGCTGWLIDDAQGCFLTAGHCVSSTFAVVEFNVPLSNADGSIVHSAPQDQYIIDQDSVQFDLTVIGNDWAYFGTFSNTETLLTPLEVQGETFILGTPPSPPSGEMIRITGYGSTTGTQGTPLAWNQVQTTHLGPLTSNSGTTLQYATDTTGGDSGSCVFDETNGVAIGIHTNAGCGAGGGANNGTSLNNTGLQSALANPQGVCANGAPEVRFHLLNPIANPIPTTGTSLQIFFEDGGGGPGEINGATLIYDNGEGDQMIPFVDLDGGVNYEAIIPALTCNVDVRLRIDVEDTAGRLFRYPFSASLSDDRRVLRHVGAAFNTTFYDDFETDMGWSVSDDAGLTDGSWERAVPSGLGVREDPAADADGSGSCFVTHDSFGNSDVDGGATTLTSPAMDATPPEAHINYWRWFGDQGDSDDTFVVEISDDDGATWTNLETVGPNVTAEWVLSSFRVADFVDNTNQFRIRFTASDLGAGDIVEAAVDEVSISNTAELVVCETIFFEDGFESGDVSAWSSSVGGS